MANLFSLKTGKLFSFVGKLSEAGFTAEMAEAADLNPDLVRVMVDAIRTAQSKANQNPFELYATDQVNALRLASQEEGWGIPEETFVRLFETAPVWPKGPLAVRSLRVRFGSGDEGVTKTFEAHASRILRVFGTGRFKRADYIRSDKEHLRLLNGNQTHKPEVEWVVADLDTHRKRKSIKAVSDSKSLADELLVIAWMFPELIRSINYDKVPGFFTGGYELNVSKHDPSSWHQVPYIYYRTCTDNIELLAADHDDTQPEDSVPSLRECKS